jgi:hypothetical protein
MPVSLAVNSSYRGCKRTVWSGERKLPTGTCVNEGPSESGDIRNRWTV